MDRQISLFNISNHDESYVWRVYVDGASRKNPGLSGAGFCIYQGERFILKKGFFLGIKTNNEAEYLGMLLALFFLKTKTGFAIEVDRVDIFADSLLLVQQIRGKYRVKAPALIATHRLVLFLLQGMNFDMHHILREFNVVADAAANKGIDERIPCPDSFVTLCSAYEIKI